MKTLKDLSQLDKFIAINNGYNIPTERPKVEWWCVYRGDAVVYGKESYRNCKAWMNQFKGDKQLSIKPYKGK